MGAGPVLIDTDTLSEVLKGRDPRVAARAIEYLSLHGRLTFSIITRYEVLRGLQAKGATRQVERFEEVCRANVVLPLSDEVVTRAAEAYGGLHRRGALIGDADILIASTALVHGLDLATENTAHFERIPGLRIQSWRAP
jgi:tRNA(fMet)-specific endonuclease VapC